MSAAYRKHRVETAVSITLAVALVGLASSFLQAAVRFGITRGVARIDSEFAQLATQLNRAGNISVTFFLAAAVGAALLLVKSVPLLPRLHWLVKALGLLIAVALCCCALVVLSLTGRAPDLIIGLGRLLSNWVMSIAT